VERFLGPRNRLDSPAAMVEAEYMIAETLHQMDWTVERRPYTLTNFIEPVAPDDLPRGGRPRSFAQLTGVNLVAVKEGESSRDAVVIGAHYDTVPGSPGADDNTASLVGLLELARLLAPYRFQQTILLAVFDMEEIGLLGSKAVVAEIARQRQVKGAIIYETMCYSDPTPDAQMIPPGLAPLYPQQVRRMRRRQFRGDSTLVLYQRKSTRLARAFAEGLAHLAGETVPILVRDPLDLPVFNKVLQHAVPAVRHFARSDHFSFWEKGLSAIMITDSANLRNPHYHQASDTPDTLDYERLADIVVATAVAVARIARLC
jgi:Zn-dependent M28 family amino/carboxypeptidase